MKFPRNARMLRSQLDVAPFASVFFLVAIFAIMTSLLYTPGMKIRLPAADDLPGVEPPTIAVAVDAEGRLYFRHQQIDEKALAAKLRAEAVSTPEPLTLVIQADEAVTQASLIRLGLLARNAGITNGLLATLPRLITAPAGRAPAKP